MSKLKEQILKNTMVDGKLYSLYIGRPLARQGMIYRQDWADNLGLEAPKNVDEFFEMLRAFTEDDPDQDGRKQYDRLNGSQRPGLRRVRHGGILVRRSDELGREGRALLPKFMFDEYIETMDFFRKIRDSGYMNHDFAATSKTEQTNLLISGTAGVYVGSMQDVNSLQSRCESEQA